MHFILQLPSKDRPRELRLEVLKEAAQLGVNLYEEHQRFVMSIDPQWRADENVMLLLSAIALFTPERSNVVHKDVVKFEQVRILVLTAVVNQNLINVWHRAKLFLNSVG